MPLSRSYTGRGGGGYCSPITLSYLSAWRVRYFEKQSLPHTHDPSFRTFYTRHSSVRSVVHNACDSLPVLAAKIFANSIFNVFSVFLQMITAVLRSSFNSLSQRLLKKKRMVINGSLCTLDLWVRLYVCSSKKADSYATLIIDGQESINFSPEPMLSYICTSL